MNFIDQLAALNRGHFLDDVEENMTDVYEGVRRLRKKGTVTITLTFGMEGNEDDQLNVTAKITKKKPVKDPATTTMFIDADGSLTVKDPKQRDFGELLEVPTEASDIIDPTTGEVTEIDDVIGGTG